MNTNELFTHDTKVYRHFQAGDWTGIEDLRIPETKDMPSHRWHGGRIPMELWHQVLAFLEWSYKETKSEAIVNLFYHETNRQWAALVLPQKGYTGMTAELLPEHPDTAPTFARLGAGWEQFGTVHHHCGAAAFQSGTDSFDESTKEGLHITVGNLGSTSYSIHARTSFRRLMFGAHLLDWFEHDPAFEGLPHDLHDRLLEHRLTRPAFGAAFPDWWKSNVIHVAPPLRQTPYVDPRKSVGRRDEFGMPFSSFDQPELAYELERIQDLHGVSNREMLLAVDGLLGITSLQHDLLEALAACNRVVEDAQHICQESYLEDEDDPLFEE